MQQAATRAQPVPSSAADGNADPGALRNGFVINLTSSTSPVALKRPEHAGLRRFNFFVSRRREEGRERFRLHMGYFDTQEEAEKLLDIVREIYPGAWAGLAPGRGLRGTPPVAQPDEVAPVAASSEPIPAPIGTRSDAASRSDSRAAAAAPKAAARSVAQRPAAVPSSRGTSTTTDRRARAPSERHAATQSLGNVRAAIDALEDSLGAAAAAPPPPSKPRVVPTLRPAHPIPTLKPIAQPAPAARTAGTQAAKAGSRPAQQATREISERAALKLLEGSAHAARKAPPPAAAQERPCFAVQLAWSVDPIDLTSVPQLAIFNAYTLYGAQGHREGRRWYGLRLGFFTDAVSAKQVAQYVRSDFTTVSVVPVSTRERDQAKRAIASAPSPTTVEPVPGAARPARTPGQTVSIDEFKFIDDAVESLPKVGNEPRAGASSEPAVRPSRGAPGKRAVFRAGRIHATRKAKQMTLEETLEILGANDLEVDARKKGAANGEAPTPTAPAQGKASKLSRLFERLSERLGT